MIFANFISDVMTGLALILLFFGLVLWLIVAAAGMLFRHMRNDVRRKGGAKAVLKQGAAKATGRLLRRWLIGG